MVSEPLCRAEDALRGMLGKPEGQEGSAPNGEVRRVKADGTQA